MRHRDIVAIAQTLAAMRPQEFVGGSVLAHNAMLNQWSYTVGGFISVLGRTCRNFNVQEFHDICYRRDVCNS